MRPGRIVLLLTLCGLLGGAQRATRAAPPEFWDQVKFVIERYLGRPYVWGGAGLKNFDCSGFAWRVMFENGILVKRTTARKYYMTLPPVPKGGDPFQFGNLIFFDNLKHMGIVNTNSSFYQAQLSKGTNLSELDAFWKPQICGFRRMPSP
jgi:cell wall-associated NlpC family hydrolase